MDKCLECGSELTQTVGKRKKMYCGDTCRVKYFLKKKNEGRVYKKRGRKPKPETTVGVLKQAIENMGKVPVSVPSKEYDNRTNPLINAARGRDASGINEDEIKPKNDPKEGSAAFMMKYGVSTYEELKNKGGNK